MSQTKVSDLTVEEFKAIVREVVAQALLDTIDPDAGLEMREDMAAKLRQSITAVEAGADTTPAEEVAARLGLEW